MATYVVIDHKIYILDFHKTFCLVKPYGNRFVALVLAIAFLIPEILKTMKNSSNGEKKQTLDLNLSEKNVKIETEWKTRQIAEDKQTLDLSEKK